MTEYRAKTFKSGNSVALRLPKGLGLKEGLEMTVREEQGRYVVEPVGKPKRKIDVSKFWGSASGLRLLAPEDRVFEDSRRPWDLLGIDLPDDDDKA